MKLFGNTFQDIREIQGFSKEEILEVKQDLTKFKTENAEQTKINDYLKKRFPNEILEFYKIYLTKIKDFYNIYVKTSENSDMIFDLNYFHIKTQIQKEIQLISTNLTNFKLNARNIKRFFKNNTFLEEFLEPIRELDELCIELISGLEKSIRTVEKPYNNDIYIWIGTNKIKNPNFKLNKLSDNLEIWENIKDFYEFVEKTNGSSDAKKKKKKKEDALTSDFKQLEQFYLDKSKENQEFNEDLIYLLNQIKVFEEIKGEEFINVLERKEIGKILKEFMRTLIKSLLEDSFTVILEELKELVQKFNIDNLDSKIPLKDLLKQEYHQFLPHLVDYYYNGLDQHYHEIINNMTESDDIKDTLTDFSKKTEILSAIIENFNNWIINFEVFLKPYDDITGSIKQTTANVLSEITRKQEEFEYYLKSVKKERLRDNIRTYITERISSLNDIINTYQEEASQIITEEFPQLKKIREILTNYREKILSVKSEVFEQLNTFKEKDIELYQIIKTWEENFNKKRQQLKFLISLFLNKIFKNFKDLLEKEDELFESISDISQQSKEFDGLPLNYAISDYMANKLSEEEIKERIIEINSKLSILNREISIYQAELDKLEDILSTRVKIREGILTSEVQCGVCHKHINFAKENIIKCVHCDATYHYLCVAFWLDKYNSCPACQNNFVVPDSGLFDLGDNETE